MFPRLYVLCLAAAATQARFFDDTLLPDGGGELEDGGKIWVLLVAGSDGWWNYRHQADVCHAYQVVHSHGIPDERIVVMMADDIAINKNNLHNGTIMNRPNGPNVYTGVPHDYNGNENNPANFLKILNGTDMSGVGSGKTIASGPKDHIFVFFADHGAPGIICFPVETLEATDLNDLISGMHKDHKFAKLVLYIEACESGSMFNGLLGKDLNTFATTAANDRQSSYACNWDKELRTFLGDVYSVKWLENSDMENLQKETLEKQFNIVKKETNTSNVCQFGDLAMATMPVAAFQGESNPPKKKYSSVGFPDSCLHDFVDSRLVTKTILTRNFRDASSSAALSEARDELYDYLLQAEEIAETHRNIVGNMVVGNNKEDQTEEMLGALLNAPLELTQHACYYRLVESFHQHCFNLGQNEQALPWMQTFVNYCEVGFNADVGVEAILKECKDEEGQPKIEVLLH